MRRSTAKKFHSVETRRQGARNDLDWFEDAGHGKAHPQSDDTISEVRPVGDYENVYYVRVGTLRKANSGSL